MLLFIEETLFKSKESLVDFLVLEPVKDFHGTFVGYYFWSLSILDSSFYTRESDFFNSMSPSSDSGDVSVLMNEFVFLCKIACPF